MARPDRQRTPSLVAMTPIAMLLLLACTGAPGPGSAAPTTSPTVDPRAGGWRLPAGLVLEGDFELRPSSRRELAEGDIIPFALGHCGLGSPVDVDGSLWEPVGGADARGGPIDSEAEIGDLINATPGVVMLVTHERLDYRSDEAGVWVVFRRLPGPWRYPGCM
ncbi:MAG: hypothetical protein ABWZ82_09160 [Candidatus Limnocylindrales bacterium]